jgi:predicted dehydrogenase
MDLSEVPNAMHRLRVGVVGVGHLGRHHARILAENEAVELVGVVDTQPGQAQAVAEAHGTNAFTDYRELLSRVDAVCIAVPTSYHGTMARAFLERGVPAMVEKPLARSVAEAEALVALARHRDVVLQVGHIERFNPALTILDGFRIRPKYITAERLSTFTFRSTDIGVVLDLMIHDIDLVLSRIAAPVRSVSALGVSVFGELEDIAQARIEFEDGCIADLTASRASMHAVRTMRLYGAEGYATLDFAARQGTVVRPTDRLRRGELDTTGLDRTDRAAVKQHLFGKLLRVDRVQAEGPDALTLELADFVRAVRTGSRPRVTGEDALPAIRLSERIIHAIEQHAWEGRADGPIGPRELPEPWGEPIANLAGPMMWRHRATRSAARDEAEA